MPRNVIHDGIGGQYLFRRSGGYEAYAGTSMATPHIAGITALWLEATPKMTASELWDRLKVSAETLGAGADFGAGLARVPSPDPGS